MRRSRQVRTGVWQEPRRRCRRPNAVSGERCRSTHRLLSRLFKSVGGSDIPCGLDTESFRIERWRTDASARPI